MTDPLAPGTRVGPFEIEDTAGTGSSAIVYRARLVSLFERDDYPERVALKLFTLLDDEQRAVVLNEFQHARRYDSPYIAKVFPPIELGEQVALVYELGEYSLRDRLKAGPLEGVELDRLVHDLTMGLVALHENHTIHSDVKPANVLRFGDGWKLTDLGAATRFMIEADDTIAVLRAYNRPYLSPELTRQLSEARPDTDLTTRRSDDMWAMGITLFEAATGVHPFVEAEVRSATELHDVTIPARLYRSELPLSVGAVIETCLDPIPDRRWASAVMLRGLLYPAGRTHGDEDDVAAVPAASLATGTLPRPGSADRRRYLAGALLALIALGVLAVFISGRGDDGEAPETAATEPAATQPATTEPATTEPAGTEPAPVETAAAEPAVEPATPDTPAPETTVPDPLAPVQIGPAGDAGTRTPTFQWQAVPGAVYYLVWANEYADPIVPGKVDQLYTPAEVGCPDGTGVCSITSPVEFATAGEWWVTLFLADEIEHVSPGLGFTTS